MTKIDKKRIVKAIRPLSAVYTSCYMCKGLIIHNRDATKPLRMYPHFCNEVPLIIDFAGDKHGTR